MRAPTPPGSTPARHFTGYYHSTIPGVYLALVAVAATVTTVSAARGTRAALAES
jgi:hypothetical protein